MTGIRRVLSYYQPTMPWHLTYLLQATDYSYSQFLLRIKQLPDLSRIRYRGSLKITGKVAILLPAAYLTYMVLVAQAVLFFLEGSYLLAIVSLLLVPLEVALLLDALAFIGGLILDEMRKPQLFTAQQKFKAHQGQRIAVLGSFGKTTMKELLKTVLSSEMNVEATPGNQNVPISHARWAQRSVTGDEDILILEYGESEKGDIAKLATLSQPTHAVVTGVAPNHLEGFETIEALEGELATIQEFVPQGKLWCNEQASGVVSKLTNVKLYGQKQAGDWKITRKTVSLDGTSFVMKNDTVTIKIRSRLLGRHQIGPLAAVGAMAFDLGMQPSVIEEAMQRTAPFEHRMQPRLVHGAWVIDDTYNGNIEGVRAGLAFLEEISANKKHYVTPGLVEQGSETEAVHVEIGRLIASAEPDKVTLMRNSVTDAILRGLREGNFRHEVEIEEDPLHFYEHIEHQLAAGDVVLMQNDWPDKYV